MENRFRGLPFPALTSVILIALSFFSAGVLCAEESGAGFANDAATTYPAPNSAATHCCFVDGSLANTPDGKAKSWFKDQSTKTVLGVGYTQRFFFSELRNRFDFAFGAAIKPGLEFPDHYLFELEFAYGVPDRGPKSPKIEDPLWTEIYLTGRKSFPLSDSWLVGLLGGMGITRFSWVEISGFNWETNVNLAIAGLRTGIVTTLAISERVELSAEATYTYLYNRSKYANYSNVAGDETGFTISITYKPGEPACCFCALAAGL